MGRLPEGFAPVIREGVIPRNVAVFLTKQVLPPLVAMPAYVALGVAKAVSAVLPHP